MRQIQASRLHVHLLLLQELPRTSLLLDAGAVADVDELEAAGRGGVVWDTQDESLPASASVAKPAGLELSAPLMLPPSLSSGFHVLLHLQPPEFHHNLELCGVLFSDPLPEVLARLIAGRVFNRDDGSEDNPLHRQSACARAACWSLNRLATKVVAISMFSSFLHRITIDQLKRGNHERAFHQLQLIGWADPGPTLW